MADLTPDQAIQTLKGLPEDRQRAILAKLSPEVKTGIMAKLKPPATPPPAEEDWRDKFTKIDPHQRPTAADTANSPAALRYVGREGVRALSNIGAGGLGVILHPVDTATGFLKSALDTNPAVAFAEDIDSLRTGKQSPNDAMAEQIVKQPLESAETMAGQSGALGLAGEALGPGARALKETSAKMRESLVRSAASTGPDVAKELVKKTQANRDLVAKKAGEINTEDQTEVAGMKNKDKLAADKHAADSKAALDKAKADHEAAQKEYFRKQSEHKAETAKTEAENTRLTGEHKAATEQHSKLQSSLNDSERAAKVELKDVEDRVHTDADQLYKDLKPKLQDEDADPETVSKVVNHGIDNMSTAEAKPPLLEKLEKAAKTDGLTYGILDDFRSKIGNAMRKGGLSGTTYAIYEKMLEGDPEEEIPGIIDDMGRIAKEKGLSEEADTARASWRSWAEAFRDRASPLRSILKDPEEHGLMGSMRGQQSYLARLRAFGKDGAALADKIEQGLNIAQSSKAKFSPYGTIEVPKPTPPTLGEVKPFAERAPEYKAPESKPAPKPSQSLLTSGSAEERAQAKVGKPTTIGTEEMTDANKESMAAKEKRVRTGYAPIVSTGLFIDAIRSAMEGNLGHAAIDVAARGAYEIGKQGFAKLLRNPNVIETLTRPSAAQIAEIPPEMRGNIKLLAEEAQKQGIKVDPRLAALVGATLVGPKTQELQKLRTSQ